MSAVPDEGWIVALRRANLLTRSKGSGALQTCLD
jgi:hypothetical protein